MSKTIASTTTLNNGVEMPYFGLGVYLAKEGKQAREAIGHALEAGYRLIDTARDYQNERSVGEAVRASGIPREEIFITTKLWNSDHGYDKALAAFERSMATLDLDYIDLYLIHYPVKDLRGESWRALERLLDEGSVRSIGVSNYMTDHLEELLGESDVAPAVNQVELSPFLYQKELVDYCREHGIQFESYAPLVKARRLDDATLVEVGNSHGKTPAQIMLRWSIQHDIVTIPKSVNRKRIYENADIFDFELGEDEMQRLDALDEGHRTSWDPTGTP